MSVIPGRYIDSDGNEVTVIAVALDGDSGEKTVIYRMDGGKTFTLPESSWSRNGRFVCAENAELEEYLADKSRGELIHRIFNLFMPRTDVYSVHWKNAFGAEGYNYACENYRTVEGCYRGTDSCKNCTKGRLSPLDEKAVDAHLNGEKNIGIYPVSNGECKFLVFELESRSQANALRRSCDEADIPCYVEARGSGLRLWIFFAEKLPLKYLNRLGNILIARAMEQSEDIGFELYDRFIPCRRETAADSKGFLAQLPFGRVGKNEYSHFVDENYMPLADGAAEAFMVRTVTKGYLADRLAVLTQIGAEKDAVFPEKLKILLDGGIVFSKSALPTRTAMLLKRMACVKNDENPYSEFEALESSFSLNFTEDKDKLRLPRGLWSEVEAILKASGADYSVEKAFPKRSKVHFHMCKDVSEEQIQAAAELGAYGQGVLCAPLGWGKTAAVAELIVRKQMYTLILVADERTRLRWAGKIMEYLGVDVQRMGSKIHVRPVADESIKDRYGLVILADCSRLPMDGETFKRISRLSPEYMYGITDTDRRRDGKLKYIHMLCGKIIWEK